MSLLNLSGYGRLDIENVVKGLGVPFVTKIKPYKVNKSIEAIREAVRFKGVSVVISEEMCVLYAKSLGLAKGKPFRVTEKCKNHRDCLTIACPAFFIWEGKVNIDPTLCTGCAVCAQICPENAIMPLKAKKNSA